MFAAAMAREIPAEEPPRCYEREELLRLRSSLNLEGLDQVGTSLPGAPAARWQLQSNPVSELNASLTAMVVAGGLPPSWWSRCDDDAKQAALLVALRGGHMHSVYAMQPQSDLFRENLRSLQLSPSFLQEAVELLCVDAWASPSDALPREPLSWLIEKGASVMPMLPLEQPNRCLRGLRLLAELGEVALLASPEVLHLVGHKDVRIRRAAIETLDKIRATAADAPGLPEELERRIQDPDPRTREAAACALGHLGDDGVALAGAMLTHSDPAVRGLAAKALGIAGARAQCYSGSLAAWCQSESPALRAAAADALGEMGEAAGSLAAAALARSIREDEDDDVREAAAAALGKLAGAAAAEMDALVCALDDGSPFVQRAAAVALERLASPGI
mmetsp:Transcript_63290/g.137690  ORF Transcript_63290/g.137690 Transcript_63290/m.137690 type:complete len:389 (+) Transcript_63290:42-1208(+)